MYVYSANCCGASIVSLAASVRRAMHASCTVHRVTGPCAVHVVHTFSMKTPSRCTWHEYLTGFDSATQHCTCTQSSTIPLMK